MDSHGPGFGSNAPGPCIHLYVLSGKLTKNNGKSPFLVAKSTISTGPFSIAFCMFTRGYV
jgi:hypothetical protein